MTTPASKDALLAEMDSVVKQVLEQCAAQSEKAGTAGDGWSVRETLAHFLYYHESAAWGIASVAAGGPPWPNPWTADHVNEVAVPLHRNESVADLLTQIRLAHARLLLAAEQGPDLDAIAGVRATGQTITFRDRLQGTISHWSEHREALRATS